MDSEELGGQLRALRAAEGRTVASVAADAGLSVPYIANLENGRGNPTLAALDRLSRALSARLHISLVRPAPDGDERMATSAVPASLVRLSRTTRFRSAVAAMAGPLGADPDELSLRLVTALAALSSVAGTEPAEADWLRLLDALLLIAAHPAG
ncbi:MAG TPA: helix-turn-helix transcriptional regulator [Streptosporangiaceae bacterium]